MFFAKVYENIELRKPAGLQDLGFFGDSFPCHYLLFNEQVDS